MKKFYLLFFVALFTVAITDAQCTINASAQTTPGANPTANNLPCVIRGVAYDQTVQGKIQQSWDTVILVVSAHADIDSVRMDSITGLPNGISWAKNPDVLIGGGNGCVRFAGTTNDPTGRYNLTAYGTVWFHVTSPGFAPYVPAIDTFIQRAGNLNQFSPFGDYYLDVINQGDVCHAVGINDFSSDLNSALSVYPNPSNGSFEVRLNAGSRVNGDINVIDMTGRIVYSQKLDVLGLYNTTVDLTKFSKGLYTVQLRTAEGFASKNISVE